MKNLLIIILVGGLWAGCGKKENGDAGKPGAANPPVVVALTPDRSADILETAIRRELNQPKGELTKADLERVTRLDLVYTQITDAGLKEVAKMKQLTALILYETQITDAGLRELVKLENLTDLFLVGTHVTDAGLKEIAKMKQLTFLDLGGTKITNLGLKELAKLKHLEDLSLSGTQVTGAGLKEVTKLKQLTVLNLGNNKLTDVKGLEKLTESGQSRQKSEGMVNLSRNSCSPQFSTKHFFGFFLI